MIYESKDYKPELIYRIILFFEIFVFIYYLISFKKYHPLVKFIYSFKVDIVYSWVNGTDPFWKTKRIRAERKSKISISKSTINARYIDFNEIIYSIRSLEKYLNWFNKIFIVTDNQTNHFLKKNPKIIYIDHTLIFPKKALPNFNSNAIELSIGKIPGLSEHFIYMNDDLLFSKPLHKNDFFDKYGKPKFYTYKKRWINVSNLFSKYESHPKRDIYSGLQYNSIKVYTTKIFIEKTKMVPSIDVYHGPIACSKTIVNHAYRLFSNEINNTIYHNFRSYKDIYFQLLMLYTASLNSNFASLKFDSKRFLKLICLAKHCNPNFTNINHLNYMSICINSCQYTTIENQLKAKNWLQTWLNKPSSFEIFNSNETL